MAMEPVAVVRSAWDAYAAGDLDGALRFFSPDAIWHVVPDQPGPVSFRGHAELRSLFDASTRFSVPHMDITEIRDMGDFVLAHGLVHPEDGGRTILDRVTVLRSRVAGDTIGSGDAD